ncbi:4'-phosphopantetheinyl transferase family protein [Mesohalobacter salilacus]|uniref:4'-phosphopantetheinyl transferase family protein n=1 Tax=Mesohalobacter salilacus TaxID=2491711 RepID=UPI00403EC890
MVDWQTAQNQKHKLRWRSLQKLFSGFEIDYIETEPNSILAFWHLWSAKETAYKAWQRQFQSNPVFNPRAFKCINIDAENIQVEIADNIYNIKSIMSKHYIYSHINSSCLESKIFLSQEDYCDFTSEIEKLGWLIVKDKNNIPSLSHEKYNSSPISISHDSQFVALVFIKNLFG